MISSSTFITLRRRTVDKINKDQKFRNEVIGLAIEVGAIKHEDLLETEDVKLILQAPERGAITTT